MLSKSLEGLESACLATEPEAFLVQQFYVFKVIVEEGLPQYVWHSLSGKRKVQDRVLQYNPGHGAPCALHILLFSMLPTLQIQPASLIELTRLCQNRENTKK